MAPVYRIIAVAAAVALSAIGIAILVIALLARRLTQPIVSITELIGNASDGDFTVQAREDCARWSRRVRLSGRYRRARRRRIQM